MTNRSPTTDPEPADWLDLPRVALLIAHGQATRRLVELANELAAMEAALEALERRPEVATAREAYHRAGCDPQDIEITDPDMRRTRTP